MSNGALYDGIIFICSLITVIIFYRGQAHKIVGTILLIITTSYIAAKFGLPRAVLHLLITLFLATTFNRTVDNSRK